MANLYVMPIIIKMEFEDGTEETLRFPAEIWRFNPDEIIKTIPSKKKVIKFSLDPYYEIADIDRSNNAIPRDPEKPTRFKLYKAKVSKALNPMQEANQNN